MRTAGFINPNIFELRGLEYRIRFCRAPMLANSTAALRGDDLFNSYLLRGEYDAALVSVEAHVLLSRALMDKRVSDFGLAEVATFTVRRFVKYHGCLVSAISSDGTASLDAPETFHHLFNLTKDWSSASESRKAALLRANLLMVNAAGVPYESDQPAPSDLAQAERRTIVRVRFQAGPAEAAPAGFDEYLASCIAPNPLVRNCYVAKAGSPCACVLELAGQPALVDAFLADFHADCREQFPADAPATRCDEVVTKLGEGHLNVLLTVQARPETLARAEARLTRMLFEEDRTAVVRFVEEGEAIIRSIREGSLQGRCLRMLSELQVAFQLDSALVLGDVVTGMARDVVGLMIRAFARILACGPDEETVIAELKRRGWFREHAPTLGNLAPAFLLRVAPLADPAAQTDAAGAFSALLELSNRLMLSGRSETDAGLTAAERRDAERVFLRLIRVLPGCFAEPRAAEGVFPG